MLNQGPMPAPMFVTSAHGEAPCSDTSFPPEVHRCTCRATSRQVYHDVIEARRQRPSPGNSIGPIAGLVRCACSSCRPARCHFKSVEEKI
eukprot:721957-Pyramimonas_sp.AAC.1